MSRILLQVVLACFALTSIAQHQLPSNHVQGAGKVKKINDGGSTSNPSLTGNKKTRSAFPSLIGTKENTGSSTYDLQTNGSMQRRVLQQGNKISCFWTLSKETFVNASSAYTDRGTGYAYYDGSSWSAAPSAALESVRTGFASAFVDGNGIESFVCHNSTNALLMNKKNGATWTSTPMSTNTSNGPIWAHCAAAGNWLYVIASPLDSNVHANGIRNGYFFSRSDNNGSTWLDNMIPLPLVDSIGHYRGGGNSYAISAHGSHVAVLVGDMGTDLTLIKSDDYGANWSKKVIVEWPLDNFNFAGTNSTDYTGDGVPDSIYCNDGSQTMVMDTSGNVHIAFPVVRVYKPGGSAGYSFFFTTSLGYYNSVADSVALIDNIFRIYRDCNLDGTFSIGDNYSASAGPDAIYNSIGLITQPSISLNKNNNQQVVISYTAIMDADTTEDDGVHQYWNGSSALTGQNYRDVFVMASNNLGTSWTYPVNITKTSHFEEAFVSTPEWIDGNELCVLYQADIEPGTIMQNDDIYDNYLENILILQKISMADLLSAGADSLAPCGQSELPLGTTQILNAGVDNVSIYPNPTQQELTVALSNANTNALNTLQVFDITGKLCFKQTYTNLTDKATINVALWPAGIYILEANTDKGVERKQFIKE